MDVVGQSKALGHFVFGVMIPEQDKCGDARPFEPAHLLDEEDAGVVVAPCAVVKVACND